MKNIKLFIDTSDKDLAKVKLSIGIKKIKKTKVANRKSQTLLPLIVEILKENKLKFKDLDDIEVFTGPGSFTGLRVGISVAQAISYALGIKLNSKKFNIKKSIAPIYS